MSLRKLNNQNSGLLLWLTIAALLFTVLMYNPAPSFAGGGPNVGGAKLYIKQNNLEKAEEVLLKELQKVNAKNEDAWYLLGYVYARQKKYEDMLEAFNKALELKPKFAEKGVKVGGDSGPQFHAKHGVNTILKVCWAGAFNAGVKYFNDAVNAADDSSRTKAFEKAIGTFRASAKIQPDSLMSYRNWAAALMNSGHSEESVEPLTDALKIAPKDVDVSLMLAQVYMNSQKDSLAIPVLENLWTDEKGRSAEVADLLSRAYIRAGDKEKATEIYVKAIEDNPDNFHFRYNYGTILLEAQSYDTAIEQFMKAHEIDSTSSDLNYNIGAAYLNRGVSKREAIPEGSDDKSYMVDFEAAFPYLEKTISENPDNLNTWFTLGRIAGQLNKISLAGYAFAKGEPEKSALNDNVRVGMPGETLKMILGEPDKVLPLESAQFGGIEEWIYKKKAAAKGKIAVSEPLNVYVSDGKVDALMVIK